MKFKDLFSCSPSPSSKKYSKSRPPLPVERDYYYHPGGHPSSSASASASASHNYNTRNPYDIVDTGDYSYSSAPRLPPSLYDGYYDDHRQQSDNRLQQQSQRTISHSLSDSSGGVTSSSSGSGASSRCSLRKGDRVVWFRENNDFGSRSVEFGTVRWIGFIQDEDIAGIEFDQPLGLGSGWYKNEQLFVCEPHHGGLVAVAGLLLEEDYLQQQIVPEIISNLSPPQKMPHASPPWIHPPLSQDDCERFSGRSKGIQGHRNSCYLDATLFSMFSFSSVFDSILIPPLTPNKTKSEALVNGAGSSQCVDNELGIRVRQILREQIVNPLRKDLFTPAANIMKLRETMQHLDSKIISEEMDPEEYLRILFNKVLHLPEFLSLSLGQDDYFHQVLVTTPSDVDKKRIPTVQSLLEQSFMGLKLKFKTIPNPALILQMPRSGNKYRTYDGILPNLTIDVTDLLQDTPRMCAICGELAEFECPDCYGMFPASKNNPSGMASDSTSFCNQCVQRVHAKKERNGHSSISKMEFSFEPSNYFAGSRHQPVKTERTSSSRFLPFGTSSSKASSCTPHRIPRITMDLFAVICIETSHFVSFVKCGPGREAPWVFFDSMADRIESSYDGSSQGQNIPNVKYLAKMGIWLDKFEKEPGGLFLETLDNVTTELKRLITDSYICLYYSPQSSMYS